MAKKGKLLAALDAHRKKDYEKERQKKLAKRARTKQQTLEEGGESAKGRLDEVDVEAALEDMQDDIGDTEGSHESDDEDVEGQGVAIGEALDQLSEDDDDDDDNDDEDEDEEDIPLSDIEELEPEDREDIIPHQRLTINNTSALLKAHKSLALPSSLPFSATQAITSPAQIEIADVNDDLKRELAFYSQCLDAAIEGRSRLRKEGIPFSRPNDYFAEMVKTDEHMGRIKARMVEQAANKKAAAEARRQRDLKKFGKQVQVAKQQERDKQKRETLDRITQLKRKRKDAGGSGAAANEEDLFDVALDNELGDGSRRGPGGRGHGKRAKKDAKFGFGGKKRFAKSNDAASSGDIRGFSTRKMKAGGGGGGGGKKTFRPGKSKRAKM